MFSTLLFSPSSTSQHQTFLYQDLSGERVPFHMALTPYSFTPYVVSCSLKPIYTPYFYPYFIYLFYWTSYIFSLHDAYCRGIKSQSYMQGSFFTGRLLMKNCLMVAR